MKRIINMLAGGENATPVRKGVVYAALGTLIAFVLAIAVLIGSSIALTLADNAGSEPDGGEVGGDDGGATVKPVEFTTLESISALEEKVNNKKVNVKDNRTKLVINDIPEAIYYAVSGGKIELLEPAQKKLDEMLVAFYKKNSTNTALVVDGSNAGANCTMPMVTDPDGTVFTLVVCKTNEPINKNNNYQWIFEHACEYGFIYSENKFQYVGKELATYLRTSNDLTTIKAKTADKAQSLSGGYYAYYVAADATEIKVPKSLNYNVIADGANGYIVIYKK